MFGVTELVVSDLATMLKEKEFKAVAVSSAQWLTFRQVLCASTEAWYSNTSRARVNSGAARRPRDLPGKPTGVGLQPCCVGTGEAYSRRA